MTEITPPTQLGVLPKLSSLLEDDAVVFKHSCGSSAFFDWGIKILTTENMPKHQPRFQNWAGGTNILICAQCHAPVVIWNGTMYDASEYISDNEIHDVLEMGASKVHDVPAAVMDP